jgi:hypothetical protein
MLTGVILSAGGGGGGAVVPVLARGARAAHQPLGRHPLRLLHGQSPVIIIIIIIILVVIIIIITITTIITNSRRARLKVVQCPPA